MIPLLLTALLTLNAQAQDCSIPAPEESRLLALPFQEFDQSMNGGWRVYADRGCFALVAGLLDRYADANQSRLSAFERSIVAWHAGQLYAFADDYASARARFERSFHPDEPTDSPIWWNDYVEATIAFLDHDVAKLTLHRDRIAQGPSYNGEKLNLGVVEGLLKCIDQRYRVAYSNQCRPK